jgi:hypothetical protein
MKKTLLTMALVGLSAAASFAQGTIQFVNNGGSAIKFLSAAGGSVVNAPDGTVVGIFWGRTDSALSLQANTTTTFTTSGVSGLINGGSVYALTGSNPGESVFLKVAGWRNVNGTTPATIVDADKTGATGLITHYGETRTVQTTLGPTAGPGTVIFQSAAATNPTRVSSFTVAPVPEPSVVALGALGLGALLLRRRKA